MLIYLCSGSSMNPEDLASQSVRLKEEQLRREEEKLREIEVKVQREINEKRQELLARESQLKEMYVISAPPPPFPPKWCCADYCSAVRQGWHAKRASTIPSSDRMEEIMHSPQAAMRGKFEKCIGLLEKACRCLVIFV